MGLIELLIVVCIVIIIAIVTLNLMDAPSRQEKKRNKKVVEIVREMERTGESFYDDGDIRISYLDTKSKKQKGE